MSYTMEDFLHDYIKEHFPRLTPQEQREALERVSPDDRRQILLSAIFEKYREEGLAMPYTMEGFQCQFVKEHFARLTPAEREDVIKSLPPEEQEEVLRALPLERRLAGLSPEQIRQYLDRLSAAQPAAPRKPRRKT
jgi:hypothetical protein